MVNITTMRDSPMKEQIDRFSEKVDKRGHEECWEWTGAKGPEGYGRLGVDDVTMPAHRLSWQFFFGDIPKGLQVLHKCDNPSCVNPYHLFLGTQSDNIRDAYRKGRGSSQKLSIEKVDQIRVLYLTTTLSQYALAEMFDVDQSNISLICSGKTYGYA